MRDKMVGPLRPQQSTGAPARRSPGSARRLRTALALVGGSALALGLASRAEAADRADLAVVKPVIDCADLGHSDVSRLSGVETTIKSATILETPKGRFCKIEGYIAPSIHFEADLPIDRWTQRFTEGAFGRGAPLNAGGCLPATDGEFAVVGNDRGYSGGSQMDDSWTPNMQLRIDYAYRGNHVTAVVTKALIKAFYGQGPRYSYFVGCSEGGREALLEAQRYPEDFDGISAGAPVVVDSVHNAFFHPWEATVNGELADGSRILVSSRLGLLHRAVLAHCADRSGLIGSMLQRPDLCEFQRAWVECPPGSSDSATCLTTAEVDVVEKLYRGPTDAAGQRLEMGGWPLGSELYWQLSNAGHFGDRETKEGFALRRLLPAPEGNESAQALESRVAYDKIWFDKLRALAPLYNAGNTDLKRYAARGGKLILWQGAEDLIVQPQVSISYYHGVQAEMGADATDRFLRFFLIPGVAHCTGGEGPSQVDTLTPLMAWTETGQKPAKLIAGKIADTATGDAPWPEEKLPYPSVARPTLYTQPVFPFPHVARYTGRGDRGDAGNYVEEMPDARQARPFESLATTLIGPDNQSSYRVDRGVLVATPQ